MIKADTLCSINEVALTLNLTVRRIRQLQTLGILPRAITRGKYNLIEMTRAYTGYQRKQVRTLRAKGKRKVMQPTRKIKTSLLQEAINQSLREIAEAARALKKRG